jgi:hypothetical protein
MQIVINVSDEDLKTLLQMAKNQRLAYADVVALTLARAVQAQRRKWARQVERQAMWEAQEIAEEAYGHLLPDGTLRLPGDPEQEAPGEAGAE